MSTIARTLLAAAGALGAASTAAVFLAGKKPRTHSIIDPDDIVDIAGDSLRVEEHAARFVPVVYLHQELDYMRPDRVLYEAVGSGGDVLFNYFVDWPDEIHPLPFVKYPHRVFRAVYYGSPRDIEFVQVGVNRETGDVVSVAFERDPSGRPNPLAPRHDLVIARRSSKEQDFDVTINGEPFDAEPLEFEGSRVKILTATWNHIYDFYRGEGVLIDDPPLEPLTDSLYKKYSFSRRSRPPSP